MANRKNIRAISICVVLWFAGGRLAKLRMNRMLKTRPSTRFKRKGSSLNLLHKSFRLLLGL